MPPDLPRSPPVFFARATFDSGILDAKNIFGLSMLSRIRFMTLELGTVACIWGCRPAQVFQGATHDHHLLARAKEVPRDGIPDVRIFTGLQHVYMYVGGWVNKPRDEELAEAMRWMFKKPELVVVCGGQERYKRPNGA